MLRTFAVLLLLLGLATATPVVCLCAPSEAASRAAGITVDSGQAPADTLVRSETAAASRSADAPGLLAASAAAVVASLVATAGSVPAMTPWQLPSPLTIRRRPPPVAIPAGPAWTPAVPPPR